LLKDSKYHLAASSKCSVSARATECLKRWKIMLESSIFVGRFKIPAQPPLSKCNVSARAKRWKIGWKVQYLLEDSKIVGSVQKSKVPG
jgi:hypothetical protein